LTEFPLNHDKYGWREGPPGRARIILSEEDEEPHDVFHCVIGHDETKDADASLHYIATHYPAKKKA
jgi:hypothetical protein